MEYCKVVIEQNNNLNSMHGATKSIENTSCHYDKN